MIKNVLYLQENPQSIIMRWRLAIEMPANESEKLGYYMIYTGLILLFIGADAT